MLPKASIPSEYYENDLHQELRFNIDLPSSTVSRGSSLRLRAQQRNQHSNESTSIHGSPVILGDIHENKKKKKYSINTKIKRLKEIWSDVIYLTSFLRSQRKLIESKFGYGVASFFNFIGWLVQLNILLSIIMVTVLVIPQFIFKPRHFNDTIIIHSSAITNSSENKNLEKILQCSAKYQARLTESGNKQTQIYKLMNVIDGTNELENSPLFIGYYFDKQTFDSETGDMKSYYIMPLAWFGAYFASLFVVIVLSIFSHKQSCRKSLSADDLTEHSSKTFTNMVFSAWDYNQTSTKTSKLVRNNIVISLKTELANKRYIREAGQRSRLEWVLIYSIRIVMNILLLAALFGIFHLINFVYEKREELIQLKDLSYFVELLVQYLPALSIFAINTAFLFLVKLIVFEQYSASTEISLMLARTVAVRLIALLYFMIPLMKKLKIQSRTDCLQENLSSCWETQIGQEMYRIAVLHFITGAVIGPITELLRSLMNRCLGKKVKWLDGVLVPVFDIPLRALDLVYLQTVVWLGFFFFPFLPLFAAINLLFTFFAREVLLIYNHNTVDIRTYQANRSERYFVDILIYTLALSLPMLINFFTEFSRSQSCTPFRTYFDLSKKSIMAVFESEIRDKTGSFNNVFKIITSQAMLIIYLLILIMFMMRELLRSRARDSVIKLLSKELVAKSQDRKFIYHRLQDVLHTATVVKQS